MFVDESGNPVQLSPEETAQYWQSKGTQAPGTLVDDQGQPVDPFSLPAKDIADLVKNAPDKFDLISQFSARPDLQKDPATVDKVADAFHQVREQPIDWGDLIKQAPKNITNVFAGMGRFGAKAVSGTLKELVSGAVGLVSPEAAAAGQEESRKELGEIAAASELGATGLVSGAVKAAQAAGRGVGISKALKDYSQEDKRNALFDALARTTQAQSTAAGQGPLAQAVTGGAVPVSPEEVARLQDPFSWEALGGATRLAGAVLPSAAPVLSKAGELAARVGGKTITAAARTGEAASKVTEYAAAPVGAVAGAVTGAHVVPVPIVGHVIGALEGATRGSEFAHKFLEPITKRMGDAANFGKQVSGELPMTSAYAQVARDALQVAPTAVAELGKGVAFDLSQVAGADTPQEREAAVGLGTAFGLLGAANVAGRHVISGQIIAPRGFVIDKPVKSSGSFPDLDALHDANFANLNDGQRARLNATRLFLSKAAPGTDVFVTGDNAEATSSALQASGMDKSRADFFANQEGFSTRLKGKKVIGIQEPGSAPHEAFHGIEDVIGASKMRELDDAVKQQYAGDWEAFGRYYTSRLLQADPGPDWRSSLLDASGWGNAEAVEKAYREIASKAVDEAQRTGQPAPTEEQIKDAVRASGPIDWRATLTPAEQTAAADRYVAREKLAENFDAWFKHAGPTLEPGKQMPEKVARTLGQIMQFFGANPIAGKFSEGLGVPLSPEIISGVGEAARGVLPDVSAAPVLRGARVPPMIAPVSGVASTPVADNARKLAQDQPDVALPGQNQSQREIAGAAAEAFANDSGLHLQYSTAPDEPAASLSLGMNRNDRRSMIEAFRQMPDSARQLFGKLFFPKKFVQTKASGLQIQGWSPEVFAANAHRWGRFIADLSKTNPDEAIRLSKYETDDNGLTEAGWKDLYSDLQNFVASHRAGLTGAGEPLVVPKRVTEAGYFAPPTVGELGAPLPQDKADVINMLFGFKLPGREAAATRAGGAAGVRLPQNIAGRLVSEATMPGRVSAPVEPRGAFGGGAAERLGVAGEPVMEVNPYRAELEATAKALGIKAPSMIESWQNLNLNRIKEAQVAPEQPKFGANVLTLQAGFLPAAPEIPGVPKETVEKGIRVEAKDHPKVAQQAPHLLPEIVKDELRIDKKAYDEDEDPGVQPKPWEFQPTPALSDEGKKLEARGYVFGHGSNENLFHGVTVRTPDGKIMGAAQGSQMGAPTRAAIGGMTGVPEVQKGLRAEMWAYLRSRGYRTVDDYSQFTPASEKQMAEYERLRGAYEATPWWKQPFIGESETGRHSSFVGDADRGVALHSAKQRSTVFLNPARASDFLKEIGAAKTPEQKDSIVESYFTKGSGTGVGDVQFSPSNDPRGIASAAIKDPEGKIWESRLHIFAMGDYQRKHPDLSMDDISNFPQGFITNEGEFLTREQALQRARETGQLRREPKEELHSTAVQYQPKTFVVRHGSTEMNSTDPDKDLIRGHINVPLDAKGKKEAQDTGKQIAAEGGVQHIITSDLDRTVDTAKAIQEHNPGSIITEDPGLRPWNFGPTIEGKPTSEMLPRIRKLTENPDQRPAGGETFNEFKDRFLDAFHRAQDTTQDANAAIVTHYRGTKLLDAWRATGVDNDTIDKAVFEKYDKAKEPGHVDVVDKTGAQFSPKKEVADDSEWFPRTGEAGYEKPSPESGKELAPAGVTAHYWLSPSGNFYDANRFHWKWATEHVMTKGADIGDAIKKMQRNGWIRVNADGTDTADGTYIEGPRPNSAQKASLEALGFHREQAILDDSGRVAVESTKEFYQPTQFSPTKRRSKDDYKLPEGTPGMFAKAWIMPDGRPVQLGDQMHHDWLNENPDIKSKYGIKGSDEDNRVEALQKGFARVNYEKNTGTLKVEARATDWPKLREAIKQFAQVNLPRIDNMDVHLLDTKASKIVASDGVALHTYAPEEKMAQLPFIGTAGGVTEVSPQASTGMIGGQYLPSTEPRALRSAAVKDPETGQIFEGSFHADAVANALGLPSYRNATEATMASFQHGFTTNEGEFLDRDQAHARAQEMKQLQEGAAPAAESPGFKKKGGIGIEHLSLDALQKMNEAKKAIPTIEFQALPADTAGVTNRKDISDARKQWAEKGVESPYFKRWFGDSKIVDESGSPQVVYHGTTHKFAAFGDKRGNPENSLGVGHYFTTSESDAAENYATIFGPDLRARVGARVDALTSEGLSQEAAEKRASREIVGRTEQVIPAYLKAENPVVLDREGNTSTRFNYEYDEATGQESGTSVDLYNSLLRVTQQHGVDGQKIWADITANGADDLNAYDVWKGIKDSEEAMYGNDPQGRLMGSEIARQVFEDMGFDGIELTHPAKEFPGMGIDSDAKHFVVFKPEQIKGVENRGTFSQQDPRFQFMPDAKTEHFKDESKLPEALHNSRYAILTANREAIGPASHPVNQDANDNLEKALIADGYNPEPVSGEYNGVDQGKNFLVPGMTAKDAIRYAKNYGQESVLGPEGLIYQNGTVNPANPAGVKIGEEAKKSGNWSQVKGGPAFSMDLDFSKQVPLTQFSPTETDLFGAPIMEEKRAGLSTLEKSKLTKEGLKQQYPEVVIPKKRDQSIPSDIVGSPLYKEAFKRGGEPAAVNAFADRLESFAKEYQDRPAFKDGAAWYDHIAPAIKKAFPKTGQIFAELLAATSPGQTPDINFRDALQAHDRLVAGDYDKKIEKYHQGLEMAEDEKKWKAWLGKHGTDLPANPTPETFLGQWIDFHDLKLTKLNGKLFGHNSVPVLNVAARKWIAEAGPKTSNFVKNLLGTGNEATIDLWADRTMRWAGYEGKQARWRILPENKQGVDDKDFYFAQKVFAETAKRLSMRPDQLQGALWFAEKQRWADNGWSPLNLGTYEPEFGKIPESRAKIAQEQQLRELGKSITPLTGAQTELMVEPRKTL